MTYRQYGPIDPRDAFTVTAREDDEGTQSAAASQAALLLAIRSGVLGDTATVEKIPGFPLPNVRALKRSRHLKVADAAHGTWAADGSWYQPGGDFYEALKA